MHYSIWQKLERWEYMFHLLKTDTITSDSATAENYLSKNKTQLATLTPVRYHSETINVSHEKNINWVTTVMLQFLHFLKAGFIYML